MPEGHTLHRLAGSINAAFGASTPQVSSPQGRFADGAALLDGTELMGSWAHGKLLFVDFAHERTLYVHLGLIGKWFVLKLPVPGEEPEVAGVVRLRLLSEEHVADLRGPMAGWWGARALTRCSLTRTRTWPISASRARGAPWPSS